MTHEEAKSQEETKSRNFNRKFGKRYGVKLLGLQGHRNPQGQCFFDIDFLFGTRMTAEEIGYMCENIAAWIGGELRGTVNIDFLAGHHFPLLSKCSTNADPRLYLHGAVCDSHYAWDRADGETCRVKKPLRGPYRNFTRGTRRRCYSVRTKERMP